MRRLIPFTLVALAALSSCQRRDKVVVQTTEEETGQAIASVVHVADPRTAPQLLSGFYDVEQNSWRWTAGKFAVSLRAPAGAARKGATLQLKGSFPEAVFKKVGSSTLEARIGGTVVGTETLSKLGEFVFEKDVPGNLLTTNPIKVEFSLDKFLPPGTVDKRQLGIVATSIGFESK